MIKSAFVIENSGATAVMPASGAETGRPGSGSANASNDRFPPIENALTDIVKNKRLFEAQNNNV